MKFNSAYIALLVFVVACDIPNAHASASTRRTSMPLTNNVSHSNLRRSKTVMSPVRAPLKPRSRPSSEVSISVIFPNERSFSTYPQSDLDEMGGEVNALQMMPSANPLASGKVCDVDAHTSANKLSFAGQFKKGAYKFGNVVFVKIPHGIASVAGKIATFLHFPLRCGLKGFVMDLVDYFLGNHGYSQPPSGKTPAQKSLGIVTAPILLASLPFMLAGWVFGSIAEKAERKFPDNPDKAGGDGLQSIPMESSQPSLEHVNAFADAIETELAPVYASQDGRTVEQAINGIGQQLAKPSLLPVAMTRAAERLRRETGLDITAATQNMLSTQSSEILSAVNTAVDQEVSMLQK